MEILMHVCCANCALFPLQHLDSLGIGVKGLWFNPNIHPLDEYRKRLDALRRLEGLWGLDVEYVDRYGEEEFKKALQGHGGLRCEVCYAMRLEETARTAKKMGLGGFTTSLLASPYQKFGLIVETGKHIEREHGITFFAMDFRAGWKEGRRLSRDLGLYRQYYCGCTYSREERDAGKRAGAKNGRPGALRAGV